MVPQQETSVKQPSDGSPSTASSTMEAKLKGGPITGSANRAGTAAVTAEQQAQRCPRCDSLNTKFCYYNNYSLSQPRHFCKNCRRYWTKGGALRNVPVGGGCRKNKRPKHGDPSCSLDTLLTVDASGSASDLFSSIAIPGFGASTVSLIQELANEGHRLALSRLGMQMPDERFSTEKQHSHPHQPPSSTTQEFFGLPGGPPSLMGSSFDQPSTSFDPASSFTKGDPRSFFFHPHQGSELTTFLDPITSPPSLTPTPTLVHLSSFTTEAMAMDCPTSLSSNSTANMDAAQLRLMHHMPMNCMQASHQIRQAMEDHSGGGKPVNQEGEIDPNMHDDVGKNRGKPIISSISGWGQQLTGAAPNSEATDSCFYVTPQVGSAAGNDQNGLWSTSWPEMHAALAGSAGAMLH